MVQPLADTLDHRRVQTLVTERARQIFKLRDLFFEETFIFYVIKFTMVEIFLILF